MNKDPLTILTPPHLCLLCYDSPESALHYFWDCQSHTQIRQVMTDRLRNELNINASRENIIKLSLYGNIERDKQKHLFNIITEYIKNMPRFK